MEICNLKVFHSYYGEGVISKVREKYIIVKFDMGKSYKYDLKGWWNIVKPIDQQVLERVIIEENNRLETAFDFTTYAEYRAQKDKNLFKSIVEYAANNIEFKKTIEDINIVDLKGCEVSHNLYGTGIIRYQNREVIEVEFDESLSSLKFHQFDWFKYLRLTDSDMIKKLYDLRTNRNIKQENTPILTDTIDNEENVSQVNHSLIESVKNNTDLSHLISILEELGFHGLHHYTDFSNFEKIYRSKILYSRMLARRKTIFHDCANQEVITKTESSIMEYVRFYYKEKTPTLFRNEGLFKKGDKNNITDQMSSPVLLIFDSKLLIDRIDEVLISNGGCGNSSTIITSDILRAINFNWSQIMSRGSIPKYENASGEFVTDRAIINSRNAECLIKNEVDFEHLREICFRSKADYKRAHFLFGENSLFKINRDKFHNYLIDGTARMFLEDYKIYLENTSILFEFEYSCDAKDYDHEILVFDSDGIEIIKKKISVFGSKYKGIFRLPMDLQEKRIEIKYYIETNCYVEWRN